MERRVEESGPRVGVERREEVGESGSLRVGVWKAEMASEGWMAAVALQPARGPKSAALGSSTGVNGACA